MWCRTWNERQPAGGGTAARGGSGTVRTRVCALAALTGAALVLAHLAGCRSSPARNAPPAAAQSTSGTSGKVGAASTPGGGTGPTGATTPTGATGTTGATTASGAAGAGSADTETAAPVHPDVPDSARADFERAVIAMRAGDQAEAELGFKHVATEYPQFAAPLVNLAILERKNGQLDQAEDTLKSAVAHESGSAVAWTELGATQRMRGEFKEAADSYEKAIAADPHYSPAWRNLGVLSDLYLNDPKRALTAFEQYRQLSHEEEPVNGWIAELRQRLGLPPAKRPAPTAPSEGSAEGSQPPPAAPGEAAPGESAPAQPPGEKPPAQAPAAAPGDRKSTRLNSSHATLSRMPSSA